jgi:hypothetical protein
LRANSKLESLGDDLSVCVLDLIAEGIDLSFELSLKAADLSVELRVLSCEGEN